MKKERYFAYKIYRKKTINRIEKKKRLLGTTKNRDTFFFLNIRLILFILLFIILFVFNKNGYILAPIVSALFYYLAEKIIFDSPIKKRGKNLEQEAIFFFEVVNLTLESNRNLKRALEITSNNVEGELSLEFKKSFQEMKLGKSFTESLVAMKERIPSDSVNNILLTLTEASIFGNNIHEAINNQIDYLREKRMLEIKAEINKLPTKISIISVLFFIPIIMLIILSPVLLEFLLR